MPTIFFYGPKLDKEKKREMIKSACFKFGLFLVNQRVFRCSGFKKVEESVHFVKPL